MPTQIASRKASDLDHNSLPGLQQSLVRVRAPRTKSRDFTDLEKVSVGISEERPDFSSTIDGGCEKLSPPPLQRLIRRPAIRNTHRELLTDSIWVRGGRKRYGRFAGRRLASRDEEDPGPLKFDDRRGAAVFPKEGGSKDVYIERASLLHVLHNQKKRQFDALDGKLIGHARPRPLPRTLTINYAAWLSANICD